MAREKILFERGRVFIKERLPQNDLRVDSNNEILGTVFVYENDQGQFFSFKPIGSDNPMSDDWALVNGAHSIISYKNSGKQGESVTMSNNPQTKYRFCLNLNEIRSVRRHHNLPNIAHMIIVLKSGTTLPAFHFKTGGSRELLQLIKKYLPLEK